MVSPYSTIFSVRLHKWLWVMQATGACACLLLRSPPFRQERIRPHEDGRAACKLHDWGCVWLAGKTARCRQRPCCFSQPAWSCYLNTFIARFVHVHEKSARPQKVIYVRAYYGVMCVCKPIRHSFLVQDNCWHAFLSTGFPFDYLLAIFASSEPKVLESACIKPHICICVLFGTYVCKLRVWWFMPACVHITAN